jgi:hypothetical protein
MVGLLALAHIRACEAELAAINAELNPDRLPVPTRSAGALSFRLLPPLLQISFRSDLWESLTPAVNPGEGS